jgi:hypothetical protein
VDLHFNMKKKVGIYVFTKKAKDRTITKKDKYFDGKAYYGLNYIISEIEKNKSLDKAKEVYYSRKQEFLSLIKE